MAVSRAVCSVTAGYRGPQPSGESESYNLNPFNYSGAAAADTIIKNSSERPMAMFLPGKNSETMFADLGPRSRAAPTAQNLKFHKITEF